MKPSYIITSIFIYPAKHIQMPKGNQKIRHRLTNVFKISKSSFKSYPGFIASLSIVYVGPCLKFRISDSKSGLNQVLHPFEPGPCDFRIIQIFYYLIWGNEIEACTPGYPAGVDTTRSAGSIR